MEQQAGSKLGKEFLKAVYCHPAYLTYINHQGKANENHNEKLLHKMVILLYYYYFLAVPLAYKILDP